MKTTATYFFAKMRLISSNTSCDFSSSFPREVVVVTRWWRATAVGLLMSVMKPGHTGYMQVN